jgi:dUTP pyrophosphatase
MDIADFRVERCTHKAVLPVKMTEGAAGYDLAAAEEKTVLPGGKVLISTDLKMEIPDGTYGRIAPRSGLAIHHHIHIGGGVIDSDFKGLVQIIVFNLGPESFHINMNQRIAQLIIEKIQKVNIIDVTDPEYDERWKTKKPKLTPRKRMAEGFSSTDY